MLNKYTQEFNITFRAVDRDKKLTMNALVDYMQEIANQHAGILGMDFTDNEQEQEFYWIVARAKMHLSHYPKWGDKIRLTTYPVGTDKLFAVRRFEILDTNEKEIGYIIGDYILMDGKSKRPIRLRNLEDSFKYFKNKYEGETLPKLEAPKIVEKEDCRKVRLSEIDVNHHMNNAHYIRWTMDMFTSEELITKEVDTIQTNYITSLTEGVDVKITRGLDENGDIIIQGISDDGSIVYWTSKVVLRDLV